MASFFKNLFRRESDSQPVPAAPLTKELPEHPRLAATTAQGVEKGLAGTRSGLPQSAGGPFSAVSGRHMTARELAAFLPPALLRFDGVSPDQPVPLPVESLRQSMQAGRPTLRLSQIQAACPLLFQRAPQADEDIEVTLPLARVMGILECSGPVPAPHNPFEATSPGGPALEASNPFGAMAAPLFGKESESPFTAGTNPITGSVNPLGPPVPESRLGSPLNPGAVAAPISNSPFVNLPPATASPFAVEAVSSPAASPLLPAGAISGPQPISAASTEPATASPFFISDRPPSSPVVALPPDHPMLPVTGTVSPLLDPTVGRVVEPVGDRTPSPFQVVSAGAFPVAASPVAVGAHSSDVPHSPMRPQPFGLPVSSAAQSAPVVEATSPSAASLASGTKAPAAQGFPIASAPRLSTQPWTPPSSADGSAKGAPLAILPRPAPASSPGSDGFAPDSKPVPPAGPPPVRGAAFPSPFQAVHPSPSSQLASTPTPVALPAPAPAAPSPSAPVAAAGPVLPAASPSPGPPAGSALTLRGTLELSLRAVLRDVDPTRLGFAPENVPEVVRVTFPLERVTSQLASGRVEVSLDEIRAGISEKFRPAFARAAAGLQILVPMSEVFHNLPDSAKPALEPSAPEDTQVTFTTGPFQTPFAIKAEEDRNRLHDLSAAGSNPVPLAQRPATHTVPPTELPPAPLPPVPTASAGVPTVQVELPPLRPAASTIPPSGAEVPPFPRSGMFSRPPGSGTAPIPPRTAPRLKPIPVSPTAIPPFPKPDGVAGTDTPPALPPLLPLAGMPSTSAALSLPLPPVLPAMTPVASLAPPPLRSTEPGLSDDLGESYSAARLGAPPPPRAGSAPVSLPSPLTDAVLPPSALESSPPIPLPSLVSAPPSPEQDAGAHGNPGLVTGWAAPAPATPVEPEPSWEGLESSANPSSGIAAETARSASVPPPLPAFPPAPEGAPPGVAPATTPVAAASPGPVEDLSFGCVSEIRQLTLRAVLGTDQVLAPQDIVDRCARLSGLKACALFRQDSALVSQGMDPGTADAFRSSAGQTRDSLMALADSLGLGSGGNFTLRTDHGVRSFFLEPGLCLAVWHEQPAFSPGTREKLILVTQELAKD